MEDVRAVKPPSYSYFPKHGGEVVCDIYLAVPDLKRDRAASVDSCFTKVPSSGKAEEIQPPPDGGLTLTVPSTNAVRSRSVDIVLPTDEQARYKALAMAGAAAYSQVHKGYVVLALSLFFC